MIVRIKRKAMEYFLGLALALCVSLFFLSGISLIGPSVLGSNVTNQTVIARVNVTNTEPTLYLVKVQNTPIDLTAGNATTVICNGSFSDFNGYDDVMNASATLYRTTVASDALDDNNTHYTNFSCTHCEVVENTGNANGSCICRFAVQYYAENGTWACNMSIGDSALLNSSKNSSIFTMNEVLGIDVSSYTLDYGNLSASQVSRPTIQNVINTGNIPLNVTFRGYGGDNETVGENYTMLCEGGTNITFGNQRVSLYNNTPFNDMANLTNQTRQLLNLTIPKRTQNNALGNSSNSTWWRLQIPLGAAGICNGTIIFGARRADY